MVCKFQLLFNWYFLNDLFESADKCLIVGRQMADSWQTLSGQMANNLSSS